MRTITFCLALTFLLPCSLPGRAAADPAEGPVIVIEGRRQAPQVFTTLSRARRRDRAEELREDLVRRVPRTVTREPF